MTKIMVTVCLLVSFSTQLYATVVALNKTGYTITANKNNGDDISISNGDQHVLSKGGWDFVVHRKVGGDKNAPKNSFGASGTNIESNKISLIVRNENADKTITFTFSSDHLVSDYRHMSVD